MSVNMVRSFLQNYAGLVIWVSCCMYTWMHQCRYCILIRNEGMKVHTSWCKLSCASNVLVGYHWLQLDKQNSAVIIVNSFGWEGVTKPQTTLKDQQNTCQATRTEMGAPEVTVQKYQLVKECPSKSLLINTSRIWLLFHHSHECLITNSIKVHTEHNPYIMVNRH